MSCGCQSAIRVPGGPRASSEARAGLSAELAGHLRGARMSDVHLLVSEIVNNSVVHGEVDEDGWVEIEWDVSDARLRVEVSDSGLQGEPRPREPDYERGTGFGLFIVDALTERWGVVQAPVLRVWFELGLDGAG